MSRKDIVLNAARLAWRGLKRHWLLFLNAVFSCFVSLCLLGLIAMAAMHTQMFSGSLEDRIYIHAVLDEGLAGNESLEKQLEAVPGVTAVIYSDADNELELMIREKGEEFAVYRGQENPLANAYFVYLADASRIEEAAKAIGAVDGVQHAAYGGSNIATFSQLLERVRWALFAICLLFIVLAAGLVYSTIRSVIRSRQDEIQIMGLVGATERFVRLPFIMEGTFIGFLGALGAWLLCLFGYPVVYARLGGELFAPAFALMHPAAMTAWMALLLFGAGMGLGAGASYLAVWKYQQEGSRGRL